MGWAFRRAELARSRTPSSFVTRLPKRLFPQPTNAARRSKSAESCLLIAIEEARHVLA